jgi:hypothetical protein
MFPFIGSPETYIWSNIMTNFETYVSRHGEFGVQALIERIERYEGIRASIVLSLEERWNLLMQPSPIQQYRLAA